MLARAARRGRASGACDETHARELLRVLPQAIADFLEDRLETDALRAALAVRGMRYSSLGPRSAGIDAALLADSAGNDGGPPARRSTRAAVRRPWPRRSSSAARGRRRDPDRCKTLRGARATTVARRV